MIIDDPTFFDEENRYEKLNKLGNPLEKLDSVIDWNIFRKPISDGLTKAERKSRAGRPAYDYILLFKILVIQKLYNLSDEQTEYQILDRTSFRNFLGICNKVPDSTTIWLFRDNLVNADVIDKLFEIFYKQLEDKGLVSHEGCMVDASFVEVPRQRNSREENAQIKEGKTPESWDNEHKTCQKDMDARWTKKRNVVYYGYKDHIKVDKESKIIMGYTVTAANIHDSVEIEKLVNENDKQVYADAGYVGTEGRLPESVEKIICEKGTRGHELTEEQKANNKRKSKTRCRVEHVFGAFKTAMKDALKIRSIGMKRAGFSVGLANLVYNMLRYKFLQSQG